MRGLTMLGRILMAPEGDPPGGGGGSPPATPPKGPEPFAVFPTKEAFEARRDQEARAILRDKYGMTEKQLDEALARAKKLEEAEAERLKAQQTAEERLKTEKDQAEARAKQAELDAAAARQEALVTSTCARLGIKNVDYALYEANRAGKATAADLEAFFNEKLKDDSHKGAYGIAVAPVEPVPAPITTSPATPPGGNPPPPPPPPGGGQAPVVDVMKLSPSDFAAHLQRINATPGA